MATIVGLAFAAGTAASDHGAKTRVSLNAFPKPFGQVQSPKPRACAEGRRIMVFEQRGAKQRPRSDRLVVTTKTYRYHGGYQWQAKGVQEAHLYAKAKGTAGCHAARSKTVGAQPPASPAPGSGGGWGTCPDPNDRTCYLPRIHFDDGTNYCANWNSAHGDCDGVTWLKRLTTGDDLLWQTCCQFANFHWNGNEGGFRGAALYVNDDKGSHALRGYLEGSLPGPGSDRFSIRDAWNTEAPDSHWCTQDLQGTKAGDPGGPLSFDFEGGFVGADIYLDGWLVRKGCG